MPTREKLNGTAFFVHSELWRPALHLSCLHFALFITVLIAGCKLPTLHP